MQNLKMTLLQNSNSFFLEALTKAVQAEKNDEKWKFAILLLVQAIETCLKERLRRIHEIFIYTNIDKPKHTVSLNLAIERLEKIANLDLNQDDLDCIETASNLRNQIVHFEFDLSIEQIKSNFVRLVGFYTSFCMNHLNNDIVSVLPIQLHSELLKLDSYIEELESRANDRLQKESISDDEVWECPACKRYTFVIHDAIDKCYLCSHSEAVIECENCNNLEFEEDMQEIDFGNMKGLTNCRIYCKDCFNNLETKNPYDEYY